MSQGSRPSYLDYAEDNDDVLNKSWDIESRHRLQENALKLQGEDSSEGAEVFRSRVELGLHELTAALSSLSRRIDKLEESTAPPEREKQDKAVKELARSARCLSQALPGIASSRTRRRALHGYFREADDQRGNCVDRIDPATRALVVEGLSCLAGKLRVETTWGNKIEARGFGCGSGLGQSRSSASRGLSPSPPRRRISPARSTKSPKRRGRVDAEAEKEENEGKENGFDGAAAGGLYPRDGGDGDGVKVREFALPLPRGRGSGLIASSEGGFAPERLEVEHLGSLGAPSPITLAGSVDGKMFPSAPAPNRTESSRSPMTIRKEERGEAGGAAEHAKLEGPATGESKNPPHQSAGECKSDGATSRQESGSGALVTEAVPPARVAPPTRVSPGPIPAANSAAAAGSSKEGGRTATKRRPSSTGNGGVVESSGMGVEPPGRASGKPDGKRRNNSPDGSGTAGTGTDGCDGAGAGSEQELMARVLLNAAGVAAGVAAGAGERAGGPWACEEEEGHQSLSLSLARGKIVADGSISGGVGGGSIGNACRKNNCQAEIHSVRALSSRSHARRLGPRASSASTSTASSSSSSSSSSGGSASIAAAVAVASARSKVASGAPAVGGADRDKATTAVAAGEVSSGGLQVAEAAAAAGGSSSSAQPTRWRSLLDADGGRELVINGGGHRLSLNGNSNGDSERWTSPDNRNASPFVDKQGFLDLGAASASGKSLAGLEGKWPKRPGLTGSDPRVKELESRLEELKRIGDKIKREAALTTEPRVTIPTHDLTGLDLLLRNSRSKGNDNDTDNDNNSNTSGSMFMFPSSSSRHRQQHQLQQVVRTRGRVLGDDGAPLSAAAAAASSAFTSAESFPMISAAEGGLSLSSGAVADAPARPQDHPATEPALSRLLVPPFDNEALRGGFIASLEQHLAEYEDGGRREGVEAVESDKGSGPRGGGGGRRIVKGTGRARRGRDRGVVEACYDGGGGSRAAARGGKGNDDGSASLDKTTTVGGMPGSLGVASAGSSRAIDVSKQANETGSAAITSVGPTVAVSGNKVPDRKGEQEKKVVLEEKGKIDGSEGGTSKPSKWAQEYHDYLCSKES